MCLIMDSADGVAAFFLYYGCHVPEDDQEIHEFVSRAHDVYVQTEAHKS